MNKALIDFNDLAITSGIERGSPSLARSLQSTVGRFAELVKNSTRDSDVEEDEENPVLSAETVPVEQPQLLNSRRRTTAAQPHPVSMLGYQASYDEAADDYDGEVTTLFLRQEVNRGMHPF